VLSLSLRMVPLRGTFQKMARVVYDTAKKLGKQVDFTLGGEDTEIDRTLAETMGDPLMHMVRNAIDHGIEMPDVRTKNGKPLAGKIRLEAFQAGDDVVIRLIDDGGGMDPQRLRAKAIEKGLIDPNTPMDEQACFQIIFLPGFSTAAKVTDVSGRGVGMDVVRRQVEEANGTVHIDSIIGKGTTFTIRLPMTTAILDAMQLKVGAENLLMPIGSIVEMLRPQPGQVQTILDRGHVIEHRTRTLPLIKLGEALGIPGCECDPERAILVVIDNRGSDYVMQVDAILGQRQVVIKPFDEGVVHHPGTSGTTILGDGRVALILNPTFLVQHQRTASAV
jgi:two-component system chemotaxis sensor kinase CheA